MSWDDSSERTNFSSSMPVVKQTDWVLEFVPLKEELVRWENTCLLLDQFSHNHFLWKLA